MREKCVLNAGRAFGYAFLRVCFLSYYSCLPGDQLSHESASLSLSCSFQTIVLFLLPFLHPLYSDRSNLSVDASSFRSLFQRRYFCTLVCYWPLLLECTLCSSWKYPKKPTPQPSYCSRRPCFSYRSWKPVHSLRHGECFLFQSTSKHKATLLDHLFCPIFPSNTAWFPLN